MKVFIFNENKKLLYSCPFKVNITKNIAKYVSFLSAMEESNENRIFLSEKEDITNLINQNKDLYLDKNILFIDKSRYLSNFRSICNHLIIDTEVEMYAAFEEAIKNLC